MLKGMNLKPIATEEPKSSFEQEIAAAQHPSSELAKLILKLPTKPKMYPTPKASDSFRPESWDTLDIEERQTLDIINQEKAERKLTQDPIESNRGRNVTKARQAQLAAIRAQKRAIEGELKTKFIQSINREPDKKDAEQYLRWQEDQQNINRNLIDLYGQKADLIQKLPGFTQGSAKPEDVDAMANIMRDINYYEQARKVTGELQKHGKIVTSEEVENSPLGGDMKRLMNDRAAAVQAAALAAGNIYPEEIQLFLKDYEAQKPKGFWDQPWNPWHQFYTVGKHALKAMEVPAQALGGGVYGLYQNILLGKAREQAGQHDEGAFGSSKSGGGLGGGGSSRYSAPLEQKYNNGVLGQQAQQIAAEYPEQEDVTNPILAFLVGAGRGALQPWRGEASPWSNFMYDVGNNAPNMPWWTPMHYMGGLRNKWANAGLTAGASMLYDPLNLTSFGGTTKLGAAVDDVARSTANAQSLMDVGRGAEAYADAQHAYDVARSLGRVEDLGDALTLEQMIDATSDIHRASTAAKRIGAGEQVALSLRNPTTRKMAMDLPEPIRKAEAYLAQPFSGAMETLRGTKLGQSLGSMSGFGAKPMMDPATRGLSERAEFLARTGGGKNIEMQKGMQPLLKGADLGDLWRGAPMDDLDDATRRLADYMERVNAEGRIREIAQGTGTTYLDNIDDVPYMANMYANTGQETIGDLVRNWRGKVSPDEARILTHEAQRYTPEEFAAMIEGATGVRAEGNTVRQMMKDVARIRKETGADVWAKGDKSLAGIIDRIEGRQPLVKMRGRWAMPGGAVETGEGTGVFYDPNLEKMLTREEQMMRFGPNAITDPVRLTTERAAITEKGLSQNALAKWLAENYGMTDEEAEAAQAAGQVLKPVEYNVPNLYAEGPEYYYKGTEGLSDELVNLMGDEGLINPRGLVFGETATKKANVPARLVKELDYLTNPTHANKSALVRTLGKKHDSLLNFWKGQATALRPGFHGRNYLSNIWQLHLNDAAGDFFDPRMRWTYRQARTGRGGEKMAAGFKNQGLTYDDIAKMLGQENILTSGRYAEQASEMDRLVRQATTHGQVVEGLTNLAHPFSGEWGPMALGRWAGRNIENKARGIDFLSTLKQTGSPALAGEAVRKFLFNYDELSKLDRAMKRWVAPFWTWQRKNLPLQVEMLAKQPQKYHHLLQAMDAMRSAGIQETGKRTAEAKPEQYADILALGGVQQRNAERAIGKKIIEAGESVMPAYMKGLGATLLPAAYKGQPLYWNPNIPAQDLLKIPDYIHPFSEESAADVLFQTNPLFKTPAALLTNAAAKGDLFGSSPAPVPPWVGETVQEFDGLAKPAQDIGNPALQTWYTDPAVPWAIKNVSPVLSDLMGLTMTNRTDKPFQAMSRLGGLKVIPYDAPAAARQREYELGSDYDEAKRWLNTVGIDTQVDPYANPKTKVPTSPATLKKLLKLNNMELTQSNLDTLKAALEQESIYSPMPWGTLEDVQNAGKRGYIYSYNRPYMTPEQIAAVEAQISGGGGGGGRHYGGGWGGYSGGRGGRGGGARKVKKITVKDKPPVPRSPGTISGLEQMLEMPDLTGAAPLNLPSSVEAGGAAPSSLSAIQAAVASGGGMKPTTSGKYPHIGPSGMPAELAMSLQQIVANFMAQRGGPSPANLAALQSMLERAGAVSPEIMALIQQMYASMGGQVA